MRPVDRQLRNDDLASVLRDGDDSPPEIVTDIRPDPPAGRSRAWIMGAIFVAGALLGWLVIGWWLWPVELHNSAPWQMSSEHQRTYIKLVAEAYWTTSNLAEAERALTGWNRDDLNQLIGTMQHDVIDAETRRHLTTLSEALKLHGGEGSLLASVFSQQGMILSLVLSAAPLIAAVGLILVPLRRRRQLTPEAVLAEAANAGLEELLASVEIEDQPIREQAHGQRPVHDDQAEEEEPESEPEDQQVPEDKTGSLADLADLFEEEETSLTTLETMSKDLSNITADDLLKQTAKLAGQLRKSNSLRVVET